jgi:hypothetical protein
MNRVDQIEAGKLYADAKLSVDGLIAALLATFPGTFGKDNADAWKPIYYSALLGNGQRSIFSASQIHAGAMTALRAWKRRDPPKPGDIAEAASESASERREAAPSMPQIAAAAEWLCPNRLCSGRAHLATRSGLPAAAAYTVPLWRLDGERWHRRVFKCGHNSAWLAERVADGWRRLSNMAHDERIKAMQDIGLLGAVGAGLGKGSVGHAAAKAMEAVGPEHLG